MKSTKNKIYYIFCLFLIGVSLLSCDLTNDLGKISPPYQLKSKKAITNESSAELVLAGAYSKLKPGLSEFSLIDYSHIPAMLGITGKKTQFQNNIIIAEIEGFYQNQPLVISTTIEKTYTGLYNMIARCNFVIEEVSKLKSKVFKKPQRREEIIAEARALRALGNFYILRLWGQFYDNNSKFGIVLKKSIYVNDTKPRSTVSESYQAIHADLDSAIAKAPDYKAKYYLNKTSAKALKSKVYLYQGEYAKAATLAKEVMNAGSKYALTPTFNEIFDHTTKKTLDNSEGIFCVYADDKESLFSALWTFKINFSDRYVGLASTGIATIGGRQIPYDAARVRFVGAPFNNKYVLDRRLGLYETMYHLRMAEIHLIFAEAEARNKKSVTQDALKALNDVRKRVINVVDRTDPRNPKTIPLKLTPYPTITDYNQFLELVRIEKLMELAGEMGEHWYDLVRYDYLDGGFDGGFKVANVKPLAKDKDKFILPIPLNSVRASKGVVIQNPKY